jgi:phosphatidylglycerol:prolipoprotein diacylglycerol transferase
MLKYILADLIESPLYNTILDAVYYSIIFLSLVVGFYLFYRRLISLGYNEKRIKIFSLLMLVLSYPLGVISARAVNIFYFPRHLWSLNFFVDQLIFGKSITYHACFVLPIAASALFIYFLRFKFFEIWDTAFLYIPLAHAIGRVACLLVGCCWGNPVSCTFFGRTYEFDNPIPLYAIIYETMIFLFLRACFNKIYSSDTNRTYSGLIISLYLIIYGNIRLIVEIYRKTPVLSLGLTQAQIAMIFFIAVGSLMFITIMLKSLVQKETIGKTKKKNTIRPSWASVPTF